MPRDQTTPVAVTDYSRAGNMLSEFGTLWSHPGVSDESRKAFIEEVFEQVQIDELGIRAVKPADERDSRGGDLAALNGRNAATLGVRSDLAPRDWAAAWSRPREAPWCADPPTPREPDIDRNHEEGWQPTPNSTRRGRPRTAVPRGSSMLGVARTRWRDWPSVY